MAGDEEATLEMLDGALMALRRFLEAPRTVPDGIRAVEMSTILVLDALASAAPATVSEIAQRLGVTHSTASRLVQRAVDAGMVIRRTAPDGRRAAVTPTPTGTALDARAREFRQAQLRERLRAWTPAEIKSFAKAIRRFALEIPADRDPTLRRP